MKKTLNINLGGLPFIINEDAFDLLKEYLNNIEAKFSNELERKEIISDIEARVSDIFTSRLGKFRQVVDAGDVEVVIAQLGKPEDIAGEDATTATENTSKQTNSQTTNNGSFSSQRKLFRDTENKKIGGVVSGLCYYFGWGDPTIIRIGILAFTAIMAFVFHASLFSLFIIYMILLIAIPKAETTAEKLQMKGEPVNLQTIEKEVKEAFHNANASAREITNTISEQASYYKQPTKDAFDRLLKLILSIAWGFIIFFSVVFLIGLVAFFTGTSFIGASTFSDFSRLFVHDNFRMALIGISIFLVVFLPILYALYRGISYFVSNQKINPIIKRTVVGAWFIGLLLSFFTVSSLKNSFKNTASKNMAQNDFAIVGDTLFVETADDNITNGICLKTNEDDHEVKMVLGVEKTENGFAFNEVNFELAPSEDSSFHLSQTVFAKGKTEKDALDNLKNIFYFSKIDGNKLSLKSYFEIAKNGVWRNQKMTLRLYVPKGKFVKFDSNIDNMHSATVKGDRRFDDLFFANKTFVQKDNKIECINADWDEEAAADKEDEDTDEEIKDLKDVNISINDKGLKITGKDENGKDIKVDIGKNGATVTSKDSLGNVKVIAKEK